MHARDLAEPVDVLDPTDGIDAALRLIGSSRRPAVVVRDGKHHVVIPASQVLRVALPRYVLDDPALARVWDEASADGLVDRVAAMQVSDLLAAQERHGHPHEVDGDATLVEVAAVMAAGRVPLVAVVTGGKLIGAITVDELIARLTR